MYASIFGNLTAIIQRIYSRTSRFHRDLRIIEDFVRFYKIPKSTREELDEYFRHEWAYTKGVDMETVRHLNPNVATLIIIYWMRFSDLSPTKLETFFSTQSYTLSPSCSKLGLDNPGLVRIWNSDLKAQKLNTV